MHFSNILGRNENNAPLEGFEPFEFAFNGGRLGVLLVAVLLTLVMPKRGGTSVVCFNVELALLLLHPADGS